MAPAREGSGEDFASQDGSACPAYTLQRDEHLPLPFDRRVLRVGCVTLLLDFTKLRLDQVEAGIFAFEFATQSLRQRMAFPGLERRKINLRPAQLRLDATDPLGKQQTLDPIDMACAFADQTLTLPMRPARIFLLDRWHAHDGADVAFAAIDRDQGAQECQDVDPIGLDATSPTIDLDAGGIEDTAFDVELGQRSGQPESIVPGLVADQIRRSSRAATRSLATTRRGCRR